MIRYFMLPVFVAIFLSFVQFNIALAESTDRADLSTIFSDEGVQGTFVLYTLATDHLVTVDAERATKPFIPASTFKIANSIIALETGAVSDEEEIIPYGGKSQVMKIWERDMSMREAISISNVPVYQELAKRVGRERYENWLDRLDYGNKAVGEKVTRFWLDGPLEISAVEQTAFLARLAMKTLNASERSQAIVADILRLESTAETVMYAKTGWTIAPEPDIGWFVGWVNNQGEIYTFALNMDMRNRADANLRKSLALRFLRALGVY